MEFEINDRDAAGRLGKLKTKHGTILTPNLMPVINPNKMLISPKEMESLFRTDIVITNSYIINKNDELKEKALKYGVHRLIDFNGVVMTDSGTFQSYVYGGIDVDPVEIVEFQRDIGSDIGTILDVFSEPDIKRKEAEERVEETLRRARKSSKAKGEMNLACTVQGSIYTDLREKCAKILSGIGADLFAIGGVVPLMENQRYSDLLKVIISSKKGLNPSKPVHLFGAGHPLVFPIAVALGCDLFDSSSYAKYASDNRLIFPWGTEKLDELLEIPCNCPVCSEFSADELKRLEERERIIQIAKHNLYVCFSEIRKIRNAISEGSLWELVERRAASNPYLLDAMNLLKIKDNKIWLEKYEPLSKSKAMFYTGSNTLHRPTVFRLHNRILERYKIRGKNIVVFPEGNKPYSLFYSDEVKEILNRNSEACIVVDSSLGPVPIELDEMYPFAQSIFPKVLDEESEKELTRIFDRFSKGKNVICWVGKETLEQIKSGKKSYNLDKLRVSAVCEMQFGKNASKALLNRKIEIVKSKVTGKIRNVFCNGKHILSMRAEDGLFTLKIEGAKLLHSYFKKPKLRVFIENEAVPFVKDGKNVFAKFVKDCDPELRPFDECLIVDEGDELVGVGRCLLNREEMLSFKYGIAVKTRESIKGC